MQRKRLLTILAASLIATGGLVLAQNAPPAPSPAPSAQATPMPMGGQGHMGPMEHRHDMQDSMRGGMHHRMGHHGGPAGAVIGDLHRISRL